ncbi:MAG: polysaccharide biosynthesis protein [Chloroflexi bacterium]|jgi:O-antigen/teichoic acid export membrane protein|nr:polysaccharide biosynthesis protein [Chloroflexota bacterium]
MSDSGVAAPPPSGVDRRTGGRRTLGNAVLLLVTRTVSRVVVLVTVIIAQRLGRAGYGEFQTAIVFSSLSSIVADLGLQVVFTREAARHRDRLGELLAVTLGARIPLAAASGVVLAGSVALLAPSLLPLVPSLYLLLVVMSFSTVLRSCFYATQEMRWEVIAIAGETAILLGVTLLAAVNHAPVHVYIDAYTASYGFTLLLGAVVVSRRYAPLRLAWRPDELRRLLRSGLPFALAFALSTLYFRIDLVILQALHDFRQAGDYGAANKFLDGLGFVPQAVMSAVYPALSIAFTQGAAAVRPLYLRVYRLLALVGMPASVLCVALAPAIVADTHTLPTAVPSLRVLGGTAFFLFVVNSFVFTLGAMDRQLTFAALAGASVVVNVGLNLVLIPLFPFDQGPVACAWATVVTEAVLFLAGLLLLSRYLGGLPWVRPLVPVALSGAAMAAVAWPLRDAAQPLAVCVPVAVYCAAVVVTGALRPAELRPVLAAVRGRLGR